MYKCSRLGLGHDERRVCVYVRRFYIYINALCDTGENMHASAERVRRKA